MEGLCILLKKLAYPCRYTELSSVFGRNLTELCLIFNTVLDFLYTTHHHRLKAGNSLSFNLTILLLILMPFKIMVCKTALVKLKGQVIRIQEQKTMYNRYKRVHAMKYHSVIIPNCLIANLSGPFKGKQHDSTMLHQSGLLEQLIASMHSMMAIHFPVW